MWIIYEVEATINTDNPEYKPTITTYPEILTNFQDLVFTLSEICNKYQTRLPITHTAGTYNIRCGIPVSLEELNFGATGRDYQAYSISTNLGEHKIYGYIKNMSKNTTY